MTTARPHGSGLSEQAKYLVLEIPEAVERETRILGSIVPKSRLYDPYKQYRPYLEDPDLIARPDELAELENLSAWLWKEKPRATVVLKDTAYDRSSHKDSDAQAQLSDLFRASISKYKGQDVRITAGEAKRYTIDNAATVLQTRLVRNGPWLAELNKLYNEIGRPGQGSLCLVTGVYTCKGLEASWKQDEERAGGVEAKLPIGQAAVNDPVIAAKLNIGLKLHSEKKDESTVFARCEEELVFALAYDVLDLTFEDTPEPPKPKFGALRSLFQSDNTPKSVERKITGATLGISVRGEGIHPFASEHNGEAAGEFGYEEPKYETVSRPATPRDAPPETDNGHA